ncbi:hypothetical protein [Longispora urticae]
MLEQALIALAAAGGTALAEAVATDVWTVAKAGFGKAFGRGGPGEAERAERRLAATDAELVPLDGPELEQARRAAAQTWTTRLRDLLEENPEAAEDLRAVIKELAEARPGTAGVTAGDHGLAAGGNVSVSASNGGVAAGVIHGGVTIGNPPSPGAAQG